jgi:hypothetical protein
MRKSGGNPVAATRLLLAALLFVAGFASARAAGPVETSVYAVQGVDIDVTDKDAATAKEKALVDVQLKALVMLAERQGQAELLEAVSVLEAKDVLPMLKSLSIEEESISPGRYIGKFTVRFLPEKVRPVFAKHGVELADDQGPPILVIPVWSDNTGAKLWEDNLWRLAWQNLRAERSAVPTIVVLGDAEDQKLLTAADVVNNDAVKLEAIRRRYDVKSVLLAQASPAVTGGINVRIEGDSPIGRVKIDKTYTDDVGDLQGSANLAVGRFHELMVSKYRSDKAKIAAAKAEEEEAKRGPQSVPVAVPFASVSEWNSLRSRILSAPGVVGVDVSSLGADGAVIRLLYRGKVEALAGGFGSAGLAFSRVGESWVIQPN